MRKGERACGRGRVEEGARGGAREGGIAREKAPERESAREKVTVGRVHRRAQGTAGKGVGERVGDGAQEVVMAGERDSTAEDDEGTGEGECTLCRHGSGC